MGKPKYTNNKASPQIIRFRNFRAIIRPKSLKRSSVTLWTLFLKMILKLNSISIEGSESSLGRQENTAPDVIIQKVSITPEKFKDDVEALVKYIGEEHFVSGLNIEVTLSELLAVIPRKRRRCEAYNSLVKYLREERNIILTIKSNKKNVKDL